MTGAVIIGPGRAGCGLVAPALRACGYDVMFVGRNRAVVENLDALGRYRVQLVQGGRRKEFLVDGIHAMPSTEMGRVAQAIADAELVATAVGAHELAAIAPLIAEGLRRRSRPLNVLCFENLADAGPRLRAFVGEHLAGDGSVARHGFAGALILRAITRRVGDPCEGLPLTFVGDFPRAFVVERRGLAVPLPPLSGLVLTGDYEVAMRAKLYIFGAGHATAAYLGRLAGHRFVHTAMRDPRIRRTVLGAMAEGRQGIAARYGERFAGREQTLPAIAGRFDNAALRDPVSRVGRDPLRKLARDDRIVGAARLALAAGIQPVNLFAAAAAALRFAAPGDASAAQLRVRLGRDGVERALTWATGLPEGDPVVDGIVAAWDQMHRGQGRAKQHVLRR